MDPDAFSAASWFKWDPRAPLPFENRLLEAVEPPLPPAVCSMRLGELGGLEELFESYGVRYVTAAKLYELGFTVETLLDMRDEELDEMMESVCQIFRWDLLFGERYGIKSAVRAERRRIVAGDATYVLDAFPQEGLSEEPVQQGKEAVGCGGGLWEIVAARSGNVGRMRKFIKGRSRLMGSTEKEDDGDDTDRADDDDHGRGGGERLREHPFIVTEPGEVARGKKNGLDYLFHLYELCREFLIQVQHIAKERGEKCPTKVTNQVFRYAKKAGANYINKPKMRHYVHCYALHCLDEAASNALRRAFKERGENVGTWRQACYKPLVGIAASQGWDIDAIFNAHPRLSVWYVPTNLRQLCHAERRSEAALNCPFSASM